MTALTSAVLQKPVPAKYLSYSCTVEDLSPGSVVASLQVNSTAVPLDTAGVPGSTACSTALDELTDSLEARLQELGRRMVNGLTVLDAGFHQQYGTKNQVVVVKLRHALVTVNNTSDAAGDTGGGGAAGAARARGMWTGAAVAFGVGGIIGEL
jgi:hypothetical protein